MVNIHNIKRVFDRLQVRIEQCIEFCGQSWTRDDYEALLGLYVQFLPEVMDADRCGLFLLDSNHESALLIIGTGLQNQQIVAPLRGSVVGRVITTGRCIIANDLDQKSGFHNTVDNKTDYRTRNIICAPLKSENGPVIITAAVEIINKQISGGFTKDDKEQLLEVARLLYTVEKKWEMTSEPIRLHIRKLERNLIKNVLKGAPKITKNSLSKRRQRLLEIMQVINYGRIEDLTVCNGEPVFNRNLRITQDTRFGGKNGLRKQIKIHDFVLKKEIIEFFRYLDNWYHPT